MGRMLEQGSWKARWWYKCMRIQLLPRNALWNHCSDVSRWWFLCELLWRWHIAGGFHIARITERHRIRCNYCGKERHISLWRLLLKRMFSDRFYDVCPYCHKTSCYLLAFRTVHDSTDNRERTANRQKLWDNRLWNVVNVYTLSLK